MFAAVLTQILGGPTGDVLPKVPPAVAELRITGAVSTPSRFERLLISKRLPRKTLAVYESAR